MLSLIFPRNFSPGSSSPARPPCSRYDVSSSHVHTADVDDDSDPKPTQGVPGSASAFYAVLLCETLGEMKRVEASAVPRLLPYLEAGLAPAASAEQYAGALMVACQLSMALIWRCP